MNSKLWSEMEDSDIHVMWFQQDGAPAHASRVKIEMIKTVFPNRLISRFGDVPWAPLSPLDFFLRTRLKGKVFINRPSDLDELKESIIR